MSIAIREVLHFSALSARPWIGRAAACALSMVLLPALANAQRTVVKPGWNMFSPKQDVEIGRSVSANAERQLPMLNDARVDAYLNRLGRRLAEKAQGVRYPFQFKAVNDKAINAFALPGGFLYVNRDLIEAADNEAQLAGVLGHEIGHVALRHGTNQASKTQVAQAPLTILGGVLGSGSLGSVLAQLGAGFAANSVLLKYSRDAEGQADILGTQILYDSSYDPRAMSQFFEKLQAEGESGRPVEFFSSHPNPENRAKRVTEEIAKLGGVPARYSKDSSKFVEIKRYVKQLPAPVAAAAGGAGGHPSAPSDQLHTFANDRLKIEHPRKGGLAADGRGNSALTYGMMINEFGLAKDQTTLKNATHQLFDELRRANPDMTLMRQENRRVSEKRALSSHLSGQSPLGGRERVWLVTVLTNDGLLYFAGVAPEETFRLYEPVFTKMLDSVRFSEPDRRL
jgi:beta-barrel assembly-enhancing protease